MRLLRKKQEEERAMKCAAEGTVTGAWLTLGNNEWPGRRVDRLSLWEVLNVALRSWAVPSG